MKVETTQLNHGFSIKESFNSPITGRKCKTRQGYTLNHDICHVWGGNPTVWRPSKKECREVYNSFLLHAYETPVQELATYRFEYLKFLIDVFGSGNVKEAFTLKRANEDAAKVAEMMKADERKAFRAKVMKTLTDAGFTADELERIVVK